MTDLHGELTASRVFPSKGSEVRGHNDSASRWAYTHTQLPRLMTVPAASSVSGLPAGRGVAPETPAVAWPRSPVASGNRSRPCGP